jgi:SAM-dependent methyltransferase
MKLSPQDLESISGRTLDHYNRRAEAFWQGTRDHDVKQNIAALLQRIAGAPPFTILDFGCGPGRDLKAFAEHGHIAVGLEGAAHFAAMARTHSGCDVWQQDFLALDLPDNHFDGVFANAALFFMSPARNCRACCWSCTQVSNRAACCSARIRAATTRKAGTPDATALITILMLGAAICRPRDSSSLIIITAPPGCRAKGSPGWRAFGAGEDEKALPMRRER